MKKLLLVVISLLVAITAAQNRPSIPPEMKSLAFLIGSWKGEFVFEPQDGKAPRGPLTLHTEPVLDGLYLMTRLENELQGIGLIKGVTLYGFDSKEKRFKSWTFTNAGGRPDPRVEVGDVTVNRIVLVGKDEPYRQTYTLLEGNTLQLLLEAKAGSDYITVGKATLKKLPK